jgi:ribosomal protein S18 acetylase RimI-like enzyme
VRQGLAADAAHLATVRAAAEGASQNPQLDTEYFAHLIEQHPGLVYVAEAHGSVVGYLAMKRAAHAAVPARVPIQLWQLYLAPAFHGTGVAALLMSAALQQARRDQHDVIWLGVSEQNLRAIAFYRKAGFEALGRYEVGSAGHAHQDLVMSRPVHCGGGPFRAPP